MPKLKTSIETFLGDFRTLCELQNVRKKLGKLGDVSLRILKGQKLMENAKIENFNWDFLGDFQTLCKLQNVRKKVG